VPRQVAVAAELFATLAAHVHRQLLRLDPLRPIRLRTFSVRKAVVAGVVGRRRLARVPEKIGGPREPLRARGASDWSLLATQAAMQRTETIIRELLSARGAVADFQSGRFRPRELIGKVRGDGGWNDALIVIGERRKQ